MNNVLLLNKQVGETPLMCIERFRAHHPEYVGVKMTYAGRLDPIASGLLIVLAGDKVHEKDVYLGLSKTYQCTALLGVATDTYDVLGVPLSHSPSLVTAPLCKGSHGVDNVQGLLQSFVGTFQQTYPPYSSKTVDGKHLHQIARDGDIGQVDLPSRMVTVSSVEDVVVRRISRSEIRRQIIDTVSRVVGDFRQEAIMSAWEALFVSIDSDEFTTVSFTISVSSGTYIRGIVNSLGEKIGLGACILKLHRTKIGTFTEFDVDKSQDAIK